MNHIVESKLAFLLLSINYEGHFSVFTVYREETKTVCSESIEKDNVTCQGLRQGEEKKYDFDWASCTVNTGVTPK